MRRLYVVGVLGVLAGSAWAGDPEGIKVDKDKKAVIIDAKVAPRKLEKYDQIYPVEVVACWPDPKGKKAHETVVTIDVKPSDVHKALESLGLKPGKPAVGEDKVAEGPEVKVSLEIPDGGGTKKLSIHRFLLDPKTKQPFPRDVKFRFTGSIRSKPDPTKSDEVYGADLSGTLIAIYPVTDETVCQTTLTMKEEKYLKLETDTAVLPKVGTPVKLIIEPAK
ncbi:MAG TPA: YdjY domain-containing protein [Gemmataceae bacterium]|nr:YdjY domain-containing protein [Gemmataceae bacterium]